MPARAGLAAFAADPWPGQVGYGPSPAGCRAGEPPSAPASVPPSSRAPPLRGTSPAAGAPPPAKPVRIRRGRHPRPQPARRPLLPARPLSPGTPGGKASPTRTRAAARQATPNSQFPTESNRRIDPDRCTRTTKVAWKASWASWGWSWSRLERTRSTIGPWHITIISNAAVSRWFDEPLEQLPVAQPASGPGSEQDLDIARRRNGRTPIHAEFPRSQVGPLPVVPGAELGYTPNSRSVHCTVDLRRPREGGTIRRMSCSWRRSSRLPKAELPVSGPLAGYDKFAVHCSVNGEVTDRTYDIRSQTRLQR